MITSKPMREPRDGPELGRPQQSAMANHRHLMLLSILFAVTVGVWYFLDPKHEPHPIAFSICGALWAAAAIFVFLIARRLYSLKVAILLGALTILPCAGIIVPMVVSNRAKNTLRRNGFYA